jgi:phospholipase/carboxylesterase
MAAPLTTDLLPAVSKDARPLLVVLHGLGDSMEGYRWLPSALNLPWLSYLFVNAPDAYYGGYSWYDYAGEPHPGIVRSRQLLFQLLDSQREAGFPTEQTFLFGFSQGCLMSYEIALRYPRPLAGVIGISGYVHEPETLLAERAPAAAQQQILVTHGVYDPVIPFTAAREQANQLKAEGIHLEWHEFPKEHTLAGEAELAVIREFVKRRTSG